MKIEQGKPIGTLICEFLMEGKTPEGVKKNNFQGKQGQAFSVQDKGKRILLVGLGKKDKYRLDNLRIAGGICARYAKSIQEKEFSVMLPQNAGDMEAQAITEGIILASYEFRRYKTEKEEFPGISKIHLVGKRNVSSGIRSGTIYAGAQNFSREIDEQPSNKATPTSIAKEAKKLAKEKKLAVTVYDRKSLEKMKMEGILGVARGSVEPPVLVKLEYNKGKNYPLYCIVGKGITFDTGGISLKPSKNMHEMKYDKTGGVNMLGVMKAVAELKLPIRVVALIPFTENTPSGSAQKPGDIVRIYNGKTVEVLNTDAEGRMVLADALSYAVKMKPKAIIDMATLTGAIIISLGSHAIGLFSNDDKLAAALEKAGNETHERVWRLPVWPEYGEMMKSDIADLKNISDTIEAGSITAAAFLQEFIGDTKWAHLDIAGVELVKNKHSYLKGATCTGVRLLTRTLENFSRKR